MSRALLIGDRSDAGFAALRTRHFLAALAEHDVCVVDWRAGVEAAREAVAGGELDLVVTASNHGPTRVAVRLLRQWTDAGDPRADAAFWLDVAGDPWAEAQAAAAFSERAAEVAVEAQAVWSAALSRADAFSVVCEEGRHACLGALGALGRLPLLTPGDEGVHVVPNAMDFPDPAGDARGAGHRVALLGGFNTWFDEETLLAGLLAAMDRAPVEVDIAGGAIAGHHTLGFERFRSAVAASRHAGRFRFHGWVRHEELPGLLAGRHLTVVLDRAGVEPTLGSRTRVLYALHRGLRVLATTRTPLCRELASLGLIEALPAACEVGGERAAAVLADAIVEARPAPANGACDAIRRRYAPGTVTAPLRAWAASPCRLPRAPQTDALLSLCAERDALRAEIAAMRDSPTFRALDTVNRLVRRG